MSNSLPQTGDRLYAVEYTSRIRAGDRTVLENFALGRDLKTGRVIVTVEFPMLILLMERRSTHSGRSICPATQEGIRDAS